MLRRSPVVRTTPLVIVAVVAALVLTTAPASASATASLAPPATGALWGAYVKPLTGWSQAEFKDAIETLERDTGRKLAIDHHYYAWSLNFPSWKEPWDAAQGRRTMISWGGTTTSEITAGTHDAMIAARADAIKALPNPIYLRWFWEMDAQALASKAGTPAQYIGAWRRIHNIFKSRGATNVSWVWCPTAWGFATGKAQTYYPGDDYVDWVCADGYNWAPQNPGASWTQFDKIFSHFYQWGSASGKPLMVGETGTEERNAGEKAAWISGARTTLKSSYPKIKAFVYFNSIASSYSGGQYDWRVNTSTSSYDAYKAMAADPYFGAQSGGGGEPAPEPVPEPVVEPVVEPSSFPLTVKVTGPGTVVSDPPEVSCEAATTPCSSEVAAGATINLSAVPAEGARFTGWAEGCSGTSTCTLTMSQARSVTASFAVPVPHRPQVAIRRRSSASTVSAETDVTETVRTFRARIRRVKSFVLLVRNGGEEDDTLRVQGPRRAGRFRIRYFHDGSNVTSLILSGDYVTPMLSSGDGHELRMVVRRLKPKKRSRARFTVGVASEVAPTETAAVRIRLRSRRR